MRYPRVKPDQVDTFMHVYNRTVGVRQFACHHPSLVTILPVGHSMVCTSRLGLTISLAGGRTIRNRREG